jgi:predicted patatin/cPLA2 family phospholipase
MAPKYPRIAQALMNRAGLYNLQLDLAKEYEEEGRVLIVAPDDIGDMDTLTKDHEALEQMYAKGLTDARAIPEFLSH